MASYAALSTACLVSFHILPTKGNDTVLTRVDLATHASSTMQKESSKEEDEGEEVDLCRLLMS